MSKYLHGLQNCVPSTKPVTKYGIPKQIVLLTVAYIFFHFNPHLFLEKKFVFRKTSEFYVLDHFDVVGPRALFI